MIAGGFSGIYRSEFRLSALTAPFVQSRMGRSFFLATGQVRQPDFLIVGHEV